MNQTDQPIQQDQTAPAIPVTADDGATNQNESMREKVQSEVVRIITKGLEAGTINEDRARSIAKLILEKLPEDIKLQELMEVIPQLDDEFTELSDVVVPIMTEYEEKVRTIVTDKVMRLVRARKFKEAIDVTRKALDYSKKLS